MRNRRQILIPLLGAAAMALASPQGHAQRRDGRLSGSVLDKSTQKPLGGVTVVNLLDGKSTLTDSAGAFRFEKLPAGIVRFLFRVEGFPQQGLVVALAQGEAMLRTVEMDSSKVVAAAPPPPPTPTSGVQQLALVTVAETPSLGPRFANFERRRKTGAGQYVVREQIEQMGANVFTDVVRTMRGVTLDCSGGRGCGIRMVRAPMQCPPEYIVDDNVDNVFGPNVPIRDIEAVEVYTGAADVPGEYAGRNAGCGVIVIWTRSGPPQRKKKK
jgi:hypothetical protein